MAELAVSTPYSTFKAVCKAMRLNRYLSCKFKKTPIKCMGVLIGMYIGSIKAGKPSYRIL
jgi:hypothetical protein